MMCGLLIYVDDMVGNKHSYLGIQICLEDGYGKIDMTHYITKMLESVENLEVSSVPANKNILVVDERSALLSEGERKRFHTLVPQLLFLSKRARPEISAANGFLCTRVTKATEEDCLPCNRFNFFLNKKLLFYYSQSRMTISNSPNTNGHLNNKIGQNAFTSTFLINTSNRNER